MAEWHAQVNRSRRSIRIASRNKGLSDAPDTPAPESSRKHNALARRTDNGAKQETFEQHSNNIHYPCFVARLLLGPLLPTQQTPQLPTFPQRHQCLEVTLLDNRPISQYSNAICFHHHTPRMRNDHDRCSHLP